MSAGCVHGMPSPASCIDCMNDDGLGAAPTPPQTVSYPFAARYDGHCPGCNLPVHTGALIVLYDAVVYHNGCQP